VERDNIGREEDVMKKKTGVVLSLISAVILYLIFSSAVIVKAGTVAIVKEVRISRGFVALKSRPLIN